MSNYAVKMNNTGDVQKIRETIGETINQFLRDKKNRSVATYNNYKSDIEHFFNFSLEKEYVYVTVDELNAKLDAKGLRTVFNNLQDLTNEDGERVYSNNTINRKQSSIKELLAYLKDEGQYDDDLDLIKRRIKNLPKDTKAIEYISFFRALEYSNWIKENEMHKADEKYFATLIALDMGIRATEIVNLKWTDFIADDDFVIVTGVGKGNKKWNDKISIDFFNEIKKSLYKEGSNNLFTITYTDLSRTMNRAKKSLGDENRNISFHSFKKCAVTAAYRLTGDILEAQRKGRHSNINTTANDYLAQESYGITGMVSLSGGIDDELYKSVDKDVLIKAIEEMNRDFKFLLNYKINELNKIKK